MPLLASIHDELSKATIFQNFGYLTISSYPNELTNNQSNYSQAIITQHHMLVGK